MNRILAGVGLLAVLSLAFWWFYTTGRDGANQACDIREMEAKGVQAKDLNLKEAQVNDLQAQANIDRDRSTRRITDLDHKLQNAIRTKNSAKTVSGNCPDPVIDDGIVRVLSEAIADPAIPVRANPQGFVAADAPVTADTISEVGFNAIVEYNKCAVKINRIIEIEKVNHPDE